VLAGCGGGADARPAASACFRASGHQEVAGELVDIPRSLPGPPPILIAFHGLREAATWLAGQTQFDALAARHGFVVAYPNAAEGQRWQPGDVEHIRAFIDKVVEHVCADPRRVYLTGFSNGAGFAYLAGCRLSDQVAAIAPVSGSYRTGGDCSGPMPTLEIHGRDPWTGTVPRLISETQQRNGCTRPPHSSQIARGITRTRWPGCDLERIYNRTIGHEWPKLGAYNTSVEVWRFVSRYRRGVG
jgi:polyhydroxybutyrate depolymerase